jgi:quinolinate synthase
MPERIPGKTARHGRSLPSSCSLQAKAAAAAAEGPSLPFEVPPAWRVADEDVDGIRRLSEEIRALARKQSAVILAHNYQLPRVQDVSDILGDSLALSLQARETSAERIVFCGVHFMAESAKILNPEKKVLLPNLAAGCALADSITVESLAEWKARYPEHVVVTYINSSADVKALSDICCTSANAVSVVRSLREKKILFTPDRNLGRWVAARVPDKEIVVYDGACPTHDVLRGVSVKATKQAHPEAVIIAHPECREDVLDMADEICSTSGMFDAVARHREAKTFIIATEWALVYRLKKLYPQKEFVMADGCIGCRLHCPYMKMVDLPQIKRALEEDVFEIRVEEDVARRARQSLERMLEVPRDR